MKKYRIICNFLVFVGRESRVSDASCKFFGVEGEGGRQGGDNPKIFRSDVVQGIHFALFGVYPFCHAGERSVLQFKGRNE